MYGGYSPLSELDDENKSPDDDNDRQKIFLELHQLNSLIQSRLTDFRGFAKLFFDSSKEEIIQFFNSDIENGKMYHSLIEEFDPQIVVKIYNDSLFYITSLTSRHQFLTEKSVYLKQNMIDLKRVMKVITEFSE